MMETVRKTIPTQETMAGLRWLQNEFDRDISAGNFRTALLTLRLMEQRVERALEARTF